MCKTVISSLLCRRKALYSFICHNERSFSHEIISKPLKEDFDNHDHYLSVRIPKRSFSQLDLIRSKLSYWLWGNVLPENTLLQSFIVSAEILGVIRLISLFLYVSSFTWTFRHILYYESLAQVEFGTLLRSLSLFISLVYFLMIQVSQIRMNCSILWKSAYILGEISTVMELVVYPLTLLQLFRDIDFEIIMLLVNNCTSLEFLFLICCIVLCPIMMTIEAAFNRLMFLENHRKMIFIIASFLIAILSSFCFVKEQSLKGIVTLKEEYQAIGALPIGFYIFGWLAHWKEVLFDEVAYEKAGSEQASTKPSLT